MTISKRDAIIAQRTKKKRQQRMNTLLWVGGFILVVILLFASPSIYNAFKPAGAFVQITPQARPLEDGKAIGNPDAKVTIEVYEDFQCPACKSYTESIEKELLASSYITDGQVRYVFMQFPFLHSQSVTKNLIRQQMLVCVRWSKVVFGIIMICCTQTREWSKMGVLIMINDCKRLRNHSAWI